jgi:hypothetical protein
MLVSSGFFILFGVLGIIKKFCGLFLYENILFNVSVSFIKNLFLSWFNISIMEGLGKFIHVE